MPKIEQTIANVNVRAHTFRFMPPILTVQYKEPNSCNACHTDRDAAWAQHNLDQWPEVSPWRMQ
jgi:hypothetical protein